MKKTITFERLENETLPGRNFTISTPFVVVDSSKIGKPEQESSSEHHSLIVAISDVRKATWNLTDSDLMKVLFEHGRRYVEELARTNALPPETNTITMPLITSATHPEDKCPFDPSRIEKSDGASFQVEVEGPKIGFKR